MIPQVARPTWSSATSRPPALTNLWVADITCVPTRAGFLYLAVVLDVWSRRIVGWAMSTSLKTEVVVDALDMAVTQRQPRSVVHHSNHGYQYTSIAFGMRCKEAGIRPSMGTVGAPTTTRCARASSARSSASCSPAAASAPRPRRAWPSSTTSKASTTRVATALDYKSPIEYERTQFAAA